MNRITPPQKLAIYYGIPLLVNGSTSVSEAVQVFNNYDLVVFGTGLEDITHPYHQSTCDIITETDAKIFGYIDCSLSLINIVASIIKWKIMGVEGIFCDRFGYDFGLDRRDQNKILRRIHFRGLKAFVNAWNPDDVFAKESGWDGMTQMRSDDWYLGQSFQIINGEYEDVEVWKERAQKMKKYREIGPGYSRMATITTPGTSGFNQNDWDFAYYSSALWGFDAAGWGEENYSASDSLLPYRDRREIIGNKLLGDVMEGGETGVYFRTTNGGISIDTINHTTSDIFLSTQ